MPQKRKFSRLKYKILHPHKKTTNKATYAQRKDEHGRLHAKSLGVLVDLRGLIIRWKK